MRRPPCWLGLLLLLGCLLEEVELLHTSQASDGATACQPREYPARSGELELYLLLDDSASMGLLPAIPLECLTGLMLDCPAGDGSRTPWNVAVSELERFVHDPRSSGISLTLTYFGDQCSPAFYAQPSVPLGTLPQHADAIMQSLHATIPLAGTATRPALEGVLAFAAQRVATPEHAARSVVLLLTDGYPDEEDCPDNSIQSVSRVAALGASATPSIPTYVFVTSTGLDLSEIARAGNTGETILADLRRPGVLAEALQDVRERERELVSLPCDYPLPGEAAEDAQRSLVNLVHDGVPLVRVDSSSACGERDDGWHFDKRASPSRLVACPATCAALQRGQTTIQLGCPSVRD